MGGLITTPDSIVTRLVQILDEVYKDVDDTGLLLLNEILQNADDARAERVVITWFKNATSGSRNPLLNRDGLLVYNSGCFTKGNKVSFMSFGDSNKKVDENQVGRFGLGRLALFHRTDALFFCGSDGQELIFDCLSPYQDADGADYTIEAYTAENLTAHHKDWDQFDTDEKLHFVSRFQCAGLPTVEESGFAIFMPFRREEDEPVLQEWKQGAHLVKEQMRLAGAFTMPQLKHVRSATLQTIDEQGLRKDLVIEIDGNGLSRPGKEELPKPLVEHRGIVRVSERAGGSTAAAEMKYFQRIRSEETNETKNLQSNLCCWINRSGWCKWWARNSRSER